jgi:hypothetical protein
MPGTTDVKLASGLWRDGRCLREVRIAQLDAESQRTLVDSLAAAVPARRVSGLVAAAVEALADVEPFGLAEARALTVGDRDRVVLALRAALIGDAMECVCECACGETLELTVSVRTLLGNAADEPAPLEAGGVRAATGADHERAALRALEDPDAAADELVRGCMLDGRSDDVDAAARQLEELDPGAEILLRGTCPACGAEVVAALDPGGYLWTELEHRRARLELDVHTLASHYHWSEAEIVALDPPRRARYIELIAAEVGTA